jgi:hypothetical protein
VQRFFVHRFVAIILLTVPLLFGVVAVFLGQDSNWDLRNYHWYNAYALLNGRWDIDVAAAQTPTFYNPTLDVPFYLAASHLPAKVFAFLFGTLQGCNFILLYFIAMKTLRFESRARQIAASLAIAFVGMIGAGQLAQLAAMFYDNIVSLLILAAIIILLHYKDLLLQGPFRQALICVASAGLLVGFAVGLKLPTQIFAVGVCFGLLFIPGPFVRRFFLSFVCGLGIVAGFAVCGGWWMWEMWTRYENPLFPYFNDIIKSPWALFFSYRDDRYLSKTITAALTLPFRMFLDGKAVGEIAFRDARVLSVYVILFATALMLVFKRLEKTALKAPPYADAFAVRYLVALTVLSYIVWLKMFGIYRYMLPLEMLAPLVVAGCLAFWPVGRVRQASLAIAIMGFMVVTTQAGSWGRKPWAEGPDKILGGKFVDVKLPPIADPAHTMVVMMGFAPMSYLIPSFPPEIPFLRPHSYGTHPLHPTKLTEEMRTRIAAHQGDVLLLRAFWERWTEQALMPAMGLSIVPGSCKRIWDNIDGEQELCLLHRGAPSPPKLQTPEPTPKS